MLIQASIGSTGVFVQIDAEKLLDDPQSDEEINDKILTKLGPVLTALVAMINRADSPDKLFILTSSITATLNELMPRVLRYMETLENGSASVEEILHEIVAPEDDVVPSDITTEFIDSLDLDSL